MRDKILFFFVGAILVTAIYFAKDLKKLADPFINHIKDNWVSAVPLVLSFVNTGILLYILKITKDDINRKK